ncbi:broad substrate specificity ATP-binding cassette transporter ABCG2-like isoform X1 [Cavia porcellus]|uniref:ABC transporter domain-containing protein n=2 Tax=Cavia porcellus TaxID=10141 RepID=A0A286X806_CAVPO|nr:ATP-binding cassette sub-family G member 2-like isoform X1 [Cavia porcellus]XP_013005544.1 ATP-binding cassette sub-family G member 2-like isoform X1 [Cavia porcellus]
MSSSDVQISVPVSESNTLLPRTTASNPQTWTKSLVLSFHNISYRVKVKHGSLPCRKTIEKEILSNVSGIMRPGLNAIMGPTGGGKSMLLDVLAGRKDSPGLSGDVLINGELPPADFKCNSGYVVQDDVVMVTLTVRQHLEFSAALRLPTTMKNDQKNAKINDLIAELDLDGVADSKVLSKGERKRTSIAVELITDPPILFLEEPTTGLDSSTAYAVILCLKRMAMQGRTIIFSIHQPQYSIFKLFDSLTLLTSGKLVFHGPAHLAVDYFTSAGYHCEPYNNPADFILDVLSGNSAIVVNQEGESSEARETEVFYKRNKPAVENLVNLYANSSFYKEIKDELDNSNFPRGQKKRISAFKITSTTSFWHQLRCIMKRSFRNLQGFPQVTIIQLLIILAIAVITSCVFLGRHDNCTALQNRSLVLLTLVIFQCFSSVSAADIFVLEKKLFIHEYISGYYGLLPYFFGKLLSDLIPRRLLPSITFTLTVYFMFGLKKEVEAFCIMMFTVMLITYTASSMALAIAISPRIDSLTTLIMNLYFAFMLVFFNISLYSETVATIAPVFTRFQYLSIPHLGFMALQHNEFWGQNFCPEFNTAEHSGCSSYVICDGEEFLEIQGIDPSLWGFWKNLLGLTIMMIIFLFITFLRLVLLIKHYNFHLQLL